MAQAPLEHRRSGSQQTIRRRASPAAPAIHALLEHLNAAGFDAAPRPLELGPDGFETLTFLPGQSGPDWARPTPP